MTIRKRIATGMQLLYTSALIIKKGFLLYFALTVLSIFPVIGLCVLIKLITQGDLLYAFAVLFLVTAAKVFFDASIISGTLQGGVPHVRHFVEAYKQKKYSLFAWCGCEYAFYSILVLVSTHLALPIVFNSIFIITCLMMWHTATIAVIPLILDDQESFIAIIKRALTTSKTVWIEALSGTTIIALIIYGLVITIVKVLPRLVSSPNWPKKISLLRGRRSEVGPELIPFLLLACFFILAAVFKAVMYRYANRQREDELTELQVPFF